jgi:hypothetical protein
MPRACTSSEPLAEHRKMSAGDLFVSAHAAMSASLRRELIER